MNKLKKKKETQSKKIKIISIFGEISDITPATIIPELLETEFEKEKITELHIYICSSGGELSGCFAVIDFILELRKRLGIKIVTYGLGYIASAGFLLFLLGNERIMFPNCRLFVHEHITATCEDKTYGQRIKEDFTTEKEIYESYANYTTSMLNIPKQSVKKLLSLNKWLNKKDIEKYNILGENNG